MARDRQSQARDEMETNEPLAGDVDGQAEDSDKDDIAIDGDTIIHEPSAQNHDSPDTRSANACSETSSIDTEPMGLQNNSPWRSSRDEAYDVHNSQVDQSYQNIIRGADSMPEKSNLKLKVWCSAQRTKPFRNCFHQLISNFATINGRLFPSYHFIQQTIQFLVTWKTVGLDL